MCSILAILDIRDDPERLRERAARLSALQRHRGPDWSGMFVADRAVLAHERLAIVDPSSGAQPLLGPDGKLALAVNGEIYNHRELRDGLREPYTFRTGSDCEVILALYRERGPDLLRDLNGIFAFVLYDTEKDAYLVARDPIGVVPLYLGRDGEGRLHVASEMKALVPVCETVREFPPGHYLESPARCRTRDGRPTRAPGDPGRNGSRGPAPEPVRYYRPGWRDYASVADRPTAPGTIRKALDRAVRRQLMSDVPYGVLLSGGLDSSIVAALAARHAPERLSSFAIGLEGAPDPAAAREVAARIGTDHHELSFTVEEGLRALPEVIYHLETYDVTTVRAGTPMYLMARTIRRRGLKMVLSGEGSDEVFGGYLYFHWAPDARAFHEETVRKLERLHLYDCLRANKAMAAWGVEARVPFLDLEFLDVAMSVDPARKMVGPDGLEKRILREAFADLLPASVVGRQKEQFSDGVGYGWIDALRKHAERNVPDADLARAELRFPFNPPSTKEAYLYRSIFEERFPLASASECVPGGASIACSTPEAVAWSAGKDSVTDPSGRAVRGVHRTT